MAGSDKKVPSVWKPRYTITPKAARLLMEIEAARADVEHMPLRANVEAEFRRQARMRSTHYSTRIEGNRLTLEEAEQVIEEAGTEFRGRERDVQEVRNYWHALLRAEEWAEAQKPVSQDLIRRLHALVEHGPHARPSPYRDSQNVIRDSASGAIVYVPPEAREVPSLMAALVRWIRESEKTELPVPLIAGLAHYQFVTIHPHFDGNHRTARLLATFLLSRGGFGMNGLISLEEHHARDLAGYYRALAVHPHHNFYEGRTEADLTPWVEYFVETLSETFEAARREARRLVAQDMPTEQPVHVVYLEEYWISRYAETIGEYEEFRSRVAGQLDIPREFSGNKRPAILVTWHEAMRYCHEVLGEGYRLPTEAQWEKAARGRYGRRYPWGNGDPDKHLANYDKPFSSPTQEVDRYPPFLFGIHQMAGNVSEWCLTKYSGKYRSGKEDNSLKGKEPRVLRGGSFGNLQGSVRCALRERFNPDLRNHFIGFRVVLAPVFPSVL